jgi:hypothetical protein
MVVTNAAVSKAGVFVTVQHLYRYLTSQNILYFNQSNSYTLHLKHLRFLPHFN